MHQSFLKLLKAKSGRRMRGRTADKKNDARAFPDT
jgi:hypothetical protein